MFGTPVRIRVMTEPPRTTPIPFLGLNGLLTQGSTSLKLKSAKMILSAQQRLEYRTHSSTKAGLDTPSSFG